MNYNDFITQFPDKEFARINVHNFINYFKINGSWISNDLFTTVIKYDKNIRNSILIDPETLEVNFDNTKAYKFVKAINSEEMMETIYHIFETNTYNIDLQSAVENTDIEVFNVSEKLHSIVRDMMWYLDYEGDFREEVRQFKCNNTYERYEFAKMRFRCFCNKSRLPQSGGLKKKLCL